MFENGNMLARAPTRFIGISLVTYVMVCVLSLHSSSLTGRLVFLLLAVMVFGSLCVHYRIVRPIPRLSSLFSSSHPYFFYSQPFANLVHQPSSFIQAWGRCDSDIHCVPQSTCFHLPQAEFNEEVTENLYKSLLIFMWL